MSILSLNPLERKKHLIIPQYGLFSRIYEGNISVMCSMESEILKGATWTLNQVRLYHLHRPNVHFGPILPVSEQLRGRVGRTSTLGVEELQRQRFNLQSVAQAEVCARYNLFCVQMCWIAVTDPTCWYSIVGMLTYPQSLCCYAHPAGSFQSLSLCRRKKKRHLHTVEDWSPREDYSSYLTEINHGYWSVKGSSLCFHLFLFISGPVEGSNQMGKQKKTRVKFGFGYSSKEKKEFNLHSIVN